MMQTMARMKTYSPQELAALLDLCASYLGVAYQELQNRDLNRLSVEAYDACSYLKYVVARAKPDYQVH